jgi:lipid-A-disaccharide synthase
MQSDPLIYFISGEKSGDLHGTKLMHALRAHYPNFQAKGVGGPGMQAEGLKLIAPYEDFQVMGFTDVILSLPTLVHHFYGVAKSILQDQPKAVIFIDYPGFNIRLAKYLRKKGYQGKLVHYIAPSVWAWGKGRIQTMSQTLDLLLTIYPFESAYFKELKTVYVGNPLMNALKPLTTPSEPPVLALFPGSRFKEIIRNLPLQIKAASLFWKENPSWNVAISISNPQFENEILKALKDAPFPYKLVNESDRYHLMETAHAALAKSGTITLELALRGCPSVVMYQLTPLNYWLARYIFRISLPFYALPNILLNETVFPERYQVKIDPKDLAACLHEQKDIKEQALKLRNLLSDRNASVEAAKEISQIC